MKLERDTHSDHNTYYAHVRKSGDPSSNVVLSVKAPSGFVARAFILGSGYVAGGKVKIMNSPEFADYRKSDRWATIAPVMPMIGAKLPTTDENAYRRSAISDGIIEIMKSDDYLKRYNTLWLKLKDLIYDVCNTFDEDFYNVYIKHDVSNTKGGPKVTSTLIPKNLHSFLWINGVEFDPYSIIGSESYTTDIGDYYYDSNSGVFRFSVKMDSQNSIDPFFIMN